MAKNKLNYKLINITALVFLVFICLLSINIWWGIVINCVTVLLPFIIAFAFAYVFNPLVNFFVDKGFNRKIVVLIVIITLLVFLGWLFAISLPMFYEQSIELIKKIVMAFNTMDTKYDFNLGPIQIEITEYLNEMIKQIGKVASNSTFSIIGKSVDFFGKFIVGFVGFIYFLADMEKIKLHAANGLKKIGKKYYNYVKLVDEEISNYVKGMVIYMFIKTIEYSLLFFLIGHPNWMILGLLVCVMTFVPYFGGLTVNIIAVVTAGVVSIKLAILTLLVCVICGLTDSYLVSPRIYGKTNRVNPLIIIMVVSVGGTIAGPVGVVIALPCFLFIRTTSNYFSKDIKKGMAVLKKTI